MGGIDNVTWLALGAVLTAVGLALSYVVYQRRGAGAGVRAVAWSLLPLAAAMTRTLKLAAEIADDVARWVTHLVFSPTVWLGFGVFAVSAGLFVVSGAMRRRARPAIDDTGKSSVTRPKAAGKGNVKGKGKPAIDDDMADIEAILRKHGIQ